MSSLNRVAGIVRAPRKYHFPLLVVLIALLTTLPVSAQVDQGTILGYVKDTTDAAIPGATVVITNTDTNVAYTTETDATGFYRSIPMNTGNYSIEATYEGFKRTVRTGIHLDVEQQAQIDLTMEVGAVSEEVTVSAAAPLLQATEASQGEVIDNKKIVDLPLNGRDYLQLALLTKGATLDPGGRFDSFVASGMRSDHNNFLLDGMDNNSNQHAGQGRTGQVISPSIDAIQEFKVLTNAYSAEYGRNVGGVVNAVIKSGSNEFHGGLFEFIRNEELDAKNFFDSPTQDNPPYKRNQFGAFLGGRIIPDKTFFFGDYEGTIQRESGTALSTIATPLEKTGDFSQSFRSNQPAQIFDPYSYNEETDSRTQFPGNIIPANRQDPVSAQVIQFYPTPNREGITNNYLSNPGIRRDTHKWDIRIDHTFGANDRIYGRYSNHYFLHEGDGHLPEPAWGGGGNSTTFDNKNHAWMVSHTHIFTPTLFNTLKVGWNRLNTNRRAPTDTDYNAVVGINGTSSWGGLSVFSIGGYRNLGNQASTPHISDSQTTQFVNDLSWIKGRHTIKFGVNLSFIKSDHLQAYQSQGTFGFNGNFTRQTNPRGGGHQLADMLVGTPNTATLSTVATGDQRRGIHGFYANDQWRATNRLTLNIGLRYELIGPWVEKNNRYANFLPYAAEPFIQVAQDGSTFDRATIRLNTNNLAPRLGIAYRASDKTVIRAGYGIFFGGVTHIGDRYLHAGPPNHLVSVFSTDNVHPDIIIAQGFPDGAVSTQVKNLQTISQDQRNLTPYSQQWNFTLQQQLGGDISLEMGYSGSRGLRLLRRMDTNMPPPGPGNVNARRPITELAVPGLDYIVTPLADTFRREWSANSAYHAFIFNVKKRFSRGLSFLANYTWSKTQADARGGATSGGTVNVHPQNVHDLRSEWGLASEHIPHRFVVSYNYELPFGRGKPYMSNAHSVADAILGGWAVGGVTSISSGRPFTVYAQSDPCNTGGRAPCRADATGINPSLPADERTLDRWFNTDAFAQPEAYVFGSAGNNPPGARRPRLWNYDFAAYKNFYFRERFRLQFRGELFNAFNTPHFGGPGTTVNSNAFGQINGAGAPRIIQFGLKLYF